MRYSRNTILSREEQQVLSGKKAAVIGCGGLGGYLVELLGRLGIGHITVCDGDVFEITNLNRQLYATEENQGRNKAERAKQRLAEINSKVEVTVYTQYLNRENGAEILKDCDIVLDGLDSAGEKMMLQELCKSLEIPMIHGAVSEWFGQVTTVLPGDDTLTRLYNENMEETGCPSFTPAAVAGIMAGEALKVLLGKGELIRHRVLFMDLLNGEIHEGKL